MGLLKGAIGSKSILAAAIKVNLEEGREFTVCTTKCAFGESSDYRAYRLVNLPMGYTSGRLNQFWEELEGLDEGDTSFKSVVWFTDGSWAVWGEPYDGSERMWMLRSVPAMPADCM